MRSKFNLVFDIGGSESRLSTEDISKVVTVKSEYKALDPSVLIHQDTKPYELLDVKVIYSDKTEDSARIVIDSSTGLYRDVTQKLYNDKLKSESKETVFNMAKAISFFAREMDSVEILTKQEELVLTSANTILVLPPMEVSTEAGQNFKSKLNGAKIIIKYPLVGSTLICKLRNVRLLSEGVAALLGLPDEKIEEIEDDYTLIIDSGRRSTEAILVKGEDILDGGLDTFQLAGLSLESFVMAELRKKGYEINDDEVLEIIKTGKYHNKKDFSSIMNNCKRKFISLMLQRVKEFCNSIPFNYNAIDNILFFGRVYTDADNKDTITMQAIANEIFEGKKIEINNNGLANLIGAAAAAADLM